MERKTTQIIAFALMTAPLSAYALGLGSITLNSALSEKLEAEIELVSTSAQEARSIVVSLASAKEFTSAQVDRVELLNQLTFETAQRPNGSPYIKVSSLQRINEPFLNFLVQANWSSGRLIREYTLLLDPPKIKPTISEPVVADSKSTTATTRPAPVSPRFSGLNSDGKTYGPVPPSETLWGIALSTRPNRQISPQQMSVAIWKMNPQAFIDGNLNLIQAGRTLRLPDAQQLAQTTPQEAALLFEQHASGNRVSVNLTKEDQPKLADQPQQKVVITPSAPAPAVTHRLLLSVPSEEEISASDTLNARIDGKSQSGQGPIDEELSSALALENSQLRNTVDSLKEKLDQMEKLLLFTIEEQPSALPTALTPVKVEEELITDNSVEHEATVAEPTQTAEKVTTEPLPAPVNEPSQAITKEPTATVSPTVTPPPVPVVQEKIATPPQQPATPSFFDKLISDPVSLIIALLFIVLIPLIFALIRQRRQVGQAFDENLIDLESGEEEPDSQPRFDPTLSQTSSFISEFAPSLFEESLNDNFEDIDPIAEANVYLAYGRHQQALDIVQRALKDAPDRIELQEKLFDIYNATQDKDSYDALAEELSQKLQTETPTLWKKVATMGRGISPNNPIYQTLDADKGLHNLDDNLFINDTKKGIIANFLEDDSNIGSDEELYPEPSAKKEGAVKPSPLNATVGDIIPGNDDFIPTLDDKDFSPTLDIEKELNAIIQNAKAHSDEEQETTQENVNSTESGLSLYLDDDENEEEDAHEDDITTRLDLAHAYIEMDDLNAAKKLLEEVIEKGTDQQINEAHMLMSRLSA